MAEPRFEPRAFLPPSFVDQVTELRVSNPDAVRDHARGRQRRAVLAPRGKLVLLAADHPARLVTAALGDPLAMADRHSYLARILRVVASDFVDGLMGTPDVIEEVLSASRNQNGLPKG